MVQRVEVPVVRTDINRSVAAERRGLPEKGSEVDCPIGPKPSRGGSAPGGKHPSHAAIGVHRIELPCSGSDIDCAIRPDSWRRLDYPACGEDPAYLAIVRHGI